MSTEQNVTTPTEVTATITPATQEKKEAPKRREKPAKKKPADAAAAGAKKTGPGQGGSKKSAKVEDANLLGLTVTKAGDFSSWYKQIITKTEMIEYYDISGCYILRPWSFRIWELIQEFLNDKIREDGVQNSYFPLLVSKSRLEAEAEHIAGFAPEVAWITKAGQSELANHLAVRPTSETIMYPAFATWIRSHRDLPLRLNQWCNVLRWEFKHPVPFLRSREFLWQEGHSAFATKPEADAEVMTILDFYRTVFEDLMAVPVVKGYKSDGEKFAGGDYTTSVEAFIPTNGRAIQGATSHSLGQNFSKMFNIKFEAEKNEHHFAWQNSWGLTTRTIGIMTMVHGDDKGLVLPPRIAPIQVVIVPIFFKGNPNPDLVAKCEELFKEFKKRGIRVNLDDRLNYQFGWKFNFWELKGVPVRLELGGKELQAGTVLLYRRDTNTKEKVSLDNIVDLASKLLDDIHDNMLKTATAVRDSHISKVSEWSQFLPALDAGNMVMAPWCERVECEDNIVKVSGEEAKQRLEESKKAEDEEEDNFKLTASAKSLCIPLEQEKLAEGTTCFAHGCGQAAKRWTLFGRSY